MKMHQELKQAYLHERESALESTGQEAFRHLERAHILGQKNVWSHTSVHVAMLKHGFNNRDWREVIGQIFRTIAALTKTLFWVPEGNTGGANVNPFKPMPLPEDLKTLLEKK